MSHTWMPIFGRINAEDDRITFHGRKAANDEDISENIGLFICNETFTGGELLVEVTFNDIFERSAAELVLYYDPATKNTVNAGITSNDYFSIRHFANQWTTHASAGSPGSIEAGRTYNLRVRVNGSLISLFVDGVEVTRTNLPFSTPQSQVGLFSISESDVEFRNFKIVNQKPKAFVVMQFSAPYNDVYSEVIKTVCDEEMIDVLRIDEESGPGLIIADIVKSIIDANVIIAEISPSNPNVFYEVGYAHALNKPTILIAEKGTKLPFDVSPFRTLFYENTIAGKKRLEEGLRRHILTSLKERR
ncbi:MAG TPA: hypothetical protein VIQ03_00135 [Gammaproteobacteria bacterium]